MSLNVVSLAEAAALIHDGDQLAIGGGMTMTPMAFVRELVRQGKKGLRLVATPTAAINVDLLMGAGAVASMEFAQVSFGEYGMAPNFRRLVEAGRLKTLDHT